MPVYWLNDARVMRKRDLERLAIGEQEPPFANFVEYVEEILQQVFPRELVIVKRWLSGYRDFSGLGIMLIEFQPLPLSDDTQRCGSMIVKIADPSKRDVLRKELDAWEKTKPESLEGDNIFVAMKAFPPRGQGEPLALMYQDAASVLGNREVMSLEDAVFRACQLGYPLPESVFEQLNSLYERLHRFLYQQSRLLSINQYATLKANFHLARHVQHWRGPVATGAHNPLADGPTIRIYPSDAERGRIRREVLGLLSGQYADPIDYLSGIWESRATGNCPAPLVTIGASHGDLHARNVQISILGNKPDHLAVFDYESMAKDNFIVLDFIKMELELAVRLIEQEVYKDESNPAISIRQIATFWQYVQARIQPRFRQGSAMEQRGKNPIQLLPSNPTLAKAMAALPVALQRLAEGCVRLRLLAREYLRRNVEWEREYNFMMAWYAVRAGVYPNYHENHQTIALIAAGIAVQQLIGQQVAATSLERDVGELSHRPRFLLARQYARSAKPDQVAIGIAALEDLGRDYPHVLEIVEELALAYIDHGREAEAERMLKIITDKYKVTTCETPSRLGKLWKRRGTINNAINREDLRTALSWYLQAAHSDGSYFPAINVATLYLLLGEKANAKLNAEAVLSTLETVDSMNDPFWPLATRGEAMLILDEDIEEAKRCYERAVRESTCTPRDRQSMVQQLRLMKRFLSSQAQELLTDDWLVATFDLPHNQSH